MGAPAGRKWKFPVLLDRELADYIEGLAEQAYEGNQAMTIRALLREARAARMHRERVSAAAERAS